ncbi:hypothetical protein [Enterobacter ludwigii]|uniref:hypothetical protein n=1 Tax=Enterobacter ludwigii TaxID=299767 RepID=UPI003075EF4E
MKTTTFLQIDDRYAAVANYHLLLEQNGCGRGFITAETEYAAVGQLVRFDLGTGDTTYRWFTGYVERCGPAEKGFKRLFVRELAGTLLQQWPVSMQHPTLRDVCRQVESLTGLRFYIPDAGYSDIKIPHFKSGGTGLALINSLGAAFSIPDYCWQQMGDGVIYVGGYGDSRFASSPVDIPEDFIKAGSGGNTLQMGLIPAIRPGVIVNGQRISAVEIKDGGMLLSWIPKNSAGKPAWEPPEKRQIDAAYPELASGLHLPRRARVTGPTDTAELGDVSDAFRPRYAVNLQLLDADGNDAAMPELIAVPLPVPFAGMEGGLFQFPPEGALVEVGYVDGRPDKPQVRQTLPDELSLPAIKPGEQLQQHRAGVSQRITVDGSWNRETDQAINETSATRSVTSDSESRKTVNRNTLVKASDTLTVIGTASLMAGAVMQISDGDFSVGAQGRLALQAETLTEKINDIRKSVAAAQQIYGETINIGNGDINLLRCLTDTLDVLQELATLTAQHTHSNTGPPSNADALMKNASKPPALRKKYGSIIQ